MQLRERTSENTKSTWQHPATNGAQSTPRDTNLDTKTMITNPASINQSSSLRHRSSLSHSSVTHQSIVSHPSAILLRQFIRLCRREPSVIRNQSSFINRHQTLVIDHYSSLQLYIVATSRKRRGFDDNDNKFSVSQLVIVPPSSIIPQSFISHS